MVSKSPVWFLLASALTAGLLLQLTSVRAATTPLQDPDTEDTEEHEETPMEKQMERVEDAMRSLRRSVRKPESRADSLAHVQECQEGLLLAKELEPMMLARIPEAEKATFKRDFRLGMVEALETYLELERALLEERDDDAKDLYKKAAGLEDPAHEIFTEDG
ncbi:MAG TPA: hypothetical protein EYQ74_00975 [Planctomycetes bacterium]|nr:hypothetical protein [Planctomycetota bacterium]HIK60375.1 hypothetical protein [Planctomycetota bacterium]